MRAGKLHRTITIERQFSGRDEYGVPVAGTTHPDTDGHASRGDDQPVA